MRIRIHRPARKSSTPINTTLVAKQQKKQPVNHPRLDAPDPKFNFDLSKIPISSPNRASSKINPKLGNKTLQNNTNQKDTSIQLKEEEPWDWWESEDEWQEQSRDRELEKDIADKKLNKSRNKGNFLISASVGQGGENRHLDVRIVQNLLQEQQHLINKPIPESTGNINDITIGAIEDFQQSVFGWSDGKVDPDGATIRKLQKNTTIDINLLSSDELYKYYDLIADKFSQFSLSSLAVKGLEKEVKMIVDKIISRFLKGRIQIPKSLEKRWQNVYVNRDGTFPEEAIDRMKKYFVENAKKKNRDGCLETFNQGIMHLLNEMELKLRDREDKPDMSTAMRVLKRSGFKPTKKEIIYEISNAGSQLNRIDKCKLLKDDSFIPSSQSIWDAIIEMTDKNLGWNVFGLAFPNHSVTLSLNKTSNNDLYLYWSDQMDPWKPVNEKGLEKEIHSCLRLYRNNQCQRRQKDENCQVFENWFKKHHKKGKKYMLTLWHLRHGSLK